MVDAAELGIEVGLRMRFSPKSFNAGCFQFIGLSSTTKNWRQSRLF